MKTNQFDQLVFDEQDLCSLLMQGHDVTTMPHVVVDPALDLEKLLNEIEDPSQLMTWTFPENSDISVPEFDRRNQTQWFMPQSYLELDIAEYLLGLCDTPEQLQRIGKELLLFQERDMFDLLRYLKYLVDVMRKNNVIWGVGRGSSVSSYALFLLGVHRVDSLFYDLDVREFIR
jgi:DNA polymerase III alpha subunit